MITLGRLSLATSDGAVDIRKKIGRLAGGLGFSAFQATRLETITHELCRFGCRNGRQVNIDISLSTEETPPRLWLTFHSFEQIESAANINLFFDECRVSRTDNGKTVLAVCTCLPGKGDQLTPAALAEVKELLSALSSNEFLEILQEKNDDLKARAEELNKLTQAVTHSPVAVFITNLAGTIEYVNTKYTELSGYPADELLGKTPAILKSDVHPSDFYRTMWETILAGKQWHGELCNRRRNGELVWVSANISPVKNTHGELLHFVAAQEDITVRKKMDETLRNQVDEMARARRATLNILEDLNEAREQAEDATRMKSDFLSNMSHEIRTPMNAIIGMSHLALKTDLTTRQRNYLKKIQQSGQHLLGIINDILDFSKIEAGKLSVEQIDFELDKVFDNVAGLITEKTTDKGLELIFDIDRAVPNYLVGDPLRLGQILINYANNAVKFTETGEIVVGVSVVEEDGQGVLLRFTVKDSGIGLTEEQRGRLFQAFQQADSSTTRKFGGTGLGLSISKRLAELMGGEVGVESEYGTGSTFWFTARLQKGTATAKPFIPLPDLRGRRVLVVDDNEIARSVLNDMLDSMTFVVTDVASGKAALEELRAAADAGMPYEIVFLDWQMPEMSGIETVHAIRALALPKMPEMVLVTAFGREEVLKEAEQAGIRDVLIKPVHASLLFDVAIQVLGGTLGEVRSAERDVSSVVEELSRIKGALVLLVEDNEFNQEVATELLTDGGLEVYLAKNGQEAVDMVGGRAYDIVLMDMQMPVMDGVTATRMIREQVRFADLPIIAMTANAMTADRDKCLEAGMNDHIPKPIDPDHLFTTLLRWIKPRHQVPFVQVKGDNAAANEEEPIPAIPGVDIQLGLRRVLGKRKSYLGMLRKFVENQQKTPVQLAERLTAGDHATAERLAHTLKGVSGNIGATVLQGLAEELETAIREKQLPSSIATKQAVACDTLKTLIDNINQALPQEQDEEQTTQEDLAKGAELTERLIHLLENDDSDAADLFEEHFNLLQAVLEQRFKGVEQAIKQYDFEKALVLMKS